MVEEVSGKPPHTPTKPEHPCDDHSPSFLPFVGCNLSCQGASFLDGVDFSTTMGWFFALVSRRWVHGLKNFQMKMWTTFPVVSFWRGEGRSLLSPSRKPLPCHMYGNPSTLRTLNMRQWPNDKYRTWEDPHQNVLVKLTPLLNIFRRSPSQSLSSGRFRNPRLLKCTKDGPPTQFTFPSSRSTRSYWTTVLSVTIFLHRGRGKVGYEYRWPGSNSFYWSPTEDRVIPSRVESSRVGSSGIFIWLTLFVYV